MLNKSLRDQESGFTLIEVLIAVMLLSIAILAIASLSNTAIKGNKHSREVTSATVLNLSQFENLRNIAENNFDNILLTDGVRTRYYNANGISVNNGNPAIFYTQTWNVVTNGNVKNITLNISWSEFGVNKNISYAIILSR